MHIPHVHFTYLLKKEINEIYMMNALHTFALAMVGIFVPILLLTEGYSLLAVLMYLGLYPLLNIVGSFIALKHAANYGVRKTIMYSIPMMVTFLLMLFNITLLETILPGFMVLVLLALMRASAVTFYFCGFHMEFAKHSCSVIKQLGCLRASSTLFSVIGPLFGALVITFFSFHILFAVSITFLILSVIPLFFSQEEYEPFDFSLSKIIMEKSHAVPFLAEGFRDSAAARFWPILMFLISIPLASIGSVYTVSHALLALFMIYLGKRTHDGNKHRILWIGTVGNAVTLFVRVLLKTVAPIVLVQGLGGLAWTMVQLPYHSIFYNNSKQAGIANMVFFRELFLNLGRAVSVGVVMLLVLFRDAPFALAVTIASAAFVMLLMATIKDVQTGSDSKKSTSASAG